MNKRLIAFGALSLVLTANAAVMPNGQPFQVNIPNLQSGVIFNLTGLYLRPSNNQLDYVVKENGSFLVNPISYDTYAVKPGYGFGFRLGMGYVFPNSGNDLQVSYTHFNHSYTNSAVTQYRGGGPGVPVAKFLGYLAGPERFDQAMGQANFTYDQGSLTVGQYVNFGSRLTTRFFGGFSYVELTSDLNKRVSSSFVTTYDDFSALTNQSKLNGFGPTVGINTSYKITNHFGLEGEIASTLYIGKLKASGVYSEGDSPNLQLGQFTFNLPTDSVNRVVPGLESKLGLHYTFAFNRTSYLNVAAGYQVTHLFNAIDRIVPFGQEGRTNAPPMINAVTRQTSDFGMNGPYLSLTLKVG